MLGLFGPKSGKIGVYKAAFIYQGPLKEDFSAGSPAINEVVLGCCLLSYRANGEPNSSSEGVMCLCVMYLGQAFLLKAHPSIAVSPILSMWSRVSRNP